MKRSLCWLLLFSLLLSVSPVFAERTMIAQYLPTDMCILNDGVFCFVGSDSIVLYQDEQIVHTTNCEGAIACDSLRGDIYVLRKEGEETCIARYGADLTLVHEYNLGWIGQPLEFAANGTYLCVVALDPASHMTDLFFFSPDSEAITRQDTYYDVRDLTADEERIAFLCYDGFTDVIVVYYPDEDLAAVAREDAASGPVLLHPNADTCFTLTSKGIEACSWEYGKNKVWKKSIPDFQEARELADADASGIWYFHPESGRMLHVPYTEIDVANSKTLTIVNMDAATDMPYFQRVEDIFCETYPEYTVSQQNYANPDQMRLALMAGDSDADILLTSTHTSGQIVRSGVFADLRSFDCIRALEASDAYLRWPFQLLPNADNKLYVLPMSGAPEVWSVNTELFHRLGLPLPEPTWTWEDALDYGRKGKAADANVYLVNMTNSLIDRYIADHVDLLSGTADFDTEEFRELLRVYRTLIEEDLLSINFHSDEAGEYLFNGSSFVYAQADLSNMINGPLPYAGAAPNAGFSGDLMGIYANSDDQDMAAQFLSLFYSMPLSHRNQVGGQAMEYPLIFADPAVYMLSNGKTITFCPSEEVAAQVIAFAEQMDFGSGYTYLRRNISPTIKAYGQGELSLEEAVKKTQKAADIWLNE